MYKYFIKTPWWVRKFFDSYVWQLPVSGKQVFLTFDDGPHPLITPWVLAELKKYEAQATFFCIGNNVQQYPDVYKQLQDAGHAVGNHTYNHINGWKTKTAGYVDDFIKGASVIQTNLFRPPYGKITSAQTKALHKALPSKFNVIMWDVLSGDFDKNNSPEQCISNVLKNVIPGSLIVFHDSEKAFNNLKKVLPVVLKELYRTGYECRKIIMKDV